MVKDITSASFINSVSFDKKENKLLKKLTSCKTRKCSKINKERVKECAIFQKDLEKKCNQKDFKEYYKCYKKVNKAGSKCVALSKETSKCGEERCSKERKTLKKYQKNMGLFNAN